MWNTRHNALLFRQRARRYLRQPEGSGRRDCHEQTHVGGQGINQAHTGCLLNIVFLKT